MVPGHPPCALCSLIFSSLDPETNCFLPSNSPSSSDSDSFKLQLAFPLPFVFPSGLPLVRPSVPIPFRGLNLLCLLCSCQGADDPIFLLGFPLVGFPGQGQALKTIQSVCCKDLDSFPLRCRVFADLLLENSARVCNAFSP